MEKGIINSYINLCSTLIREEDRVKIKNIISDKDLKEAFRNISLKKEKANWKRRISQIYVTLFLDSNENAFVRYYYLVKAVFFSPKLILEKIVTKISMTN